MSPISGGRPASVRFCLLLPLATSLACASARAPAATLPPDAGKRLVAEHAAVTSASPLASDAGVEILRAGGNAIDAAVASAFAVGVVEPQMSGLGGGGSVVVWLSAERRAEVLDFYASQNAASYARSAAPAGSALDLREVAVPGLVAGLLELHERFGRLPRATVLGPAIRLAEQGFAVNQVLAQMVAGDSAKLHGTAAGAAYTWPGGRPLSPGARATNPTLAAALRAVADQGRDGFYRGEAGRAVVAALNAGGHPITLDEFAAYQPTWKRPLCSTYHGRTLLSAPPPQTGSQVMHTLELLEPYDLAALGLPTRSARAFDVLASALRVGMADNRANDDPRWEPVPAAGIVSEGFARERATLVGAARVPARIDAADATSFDDAPPSAGCQAYEPYRASASASTGDLDDSAPAAAASSSATAPGRTSTVAVDGSRSSFGWSDAATGDTVRDADGETTHISVVDEEGNAVALTQTNSSVFGSGAYVSGFFLNDSGYRFRAGGGPPAAAWRTRTSTIAPTIILEGDAVRMVTGAPGGGRIPTAIVQTLVYTLEYDMDPLAALRMPRMFPSPTSAEVQLENGFAADVLRDVRAMGWEPAALSFGYARLYSIVRQGDRWIAVADPRHDGEPRGW
jgi:gamma-glutamyltranspeptidase / glutathione hydrolase